MDVPTSKIGGKECVAIVAKHPFSWSILLIMGVQFGSIDRAQADALCVGARLK
jgi:hypothetical protein